MSFEQEENTNCNGHNSVPHHVEGSAQGMPFEMDGNIYFQDCNNITDHEASALLIGCFATFASQVLTKMDFIADSIGYLT